MPLFRVRHTAARLTGQNGAMTNFLRPLRRCFAAILLLAAAVVAAPPGAEAQGSGETGILALLPETATSRNSVSLGETQLAYTAEAGTLPIRQGNGTTTAKIFYVAYTADEANENRPLTFVFNGGPGAASAYLNIGALGPRIVAGTSEGSIPPPPARLVDNPDTWLAFTDLVFVDPVGTGYSRASDPKNDSDFWGVEADREAMAAFIRLYLAQKERTTSPIFLAGESYGGFRAALLAKALPDSSGVALSGVVMISPALDFSLLFGHQTAQILPFAVGLPSMAAVNFMRQGVGDRAEMKSRLKPVEDYALGDYLTALAAGPQATRERATGRVAELTGLPPDLVRRRFAAISLSTFASLFERDEGQVLSRYDGAVSGPGIGADSSFPHGPDAILDRMGPIWTSAYVGYLRSELGFRTDITYRLLNGDISRRWDYGNGGSDQGYADAMGDLQEARAYNPALQVLIAGGYTDLATPYFASRYLVSQLPPLAGAEPIRIEDYLGGHMMYLRPDSRRALMQDVRALYGEATGGAD
ncbi:S10 family peptidase [Jiella pelagia]|uniref:Peptidase S10 n=1 Tax=Jiella pelagia TaxID=2986949 RepID=A0ABY7C1X3_9HYPH|nr:peptidase S10 [Jiella pelagia]WAP69713.1 peptidase S10 [Jiella pelagia]